MCGLRTAIQPRVTTMTGRRGWGRVPSETELSEPAFGVRPVQRDGGVSPRSPREERHWLIEPAVDPRYGCKERSGRDSGKPGGTAGDVPVPAMHQ